MDLAWFLFDFRGRFSREQFWQAIFTYFAVFLCFSILIEIFLFMFAALGSWLAWIGQVSIFETKHTFRLSLPWFLCIILATPISIKRLHDRNRSGWWLIAFYLIPASDIEDHVGSSLEDIVSFLSLVLLVWGFLEIACLPGTAGSNRFGADPLKT